jgi:hypothetical protein
MVDIKQAVASAKTFVADTLGVSDFLLEEVLSEGTKFLITLSFPDRLRSHAPSPLVSRKHWDREFKTVAVDKNSGEISAMTMRTVE